MSILDIILIALGVLLVVIYLIIKLKDNNKYNKKYQQLINKGMTEAQARIECDKIFAKKKKQKQEDEDNESYFEE